jgi:hypothetical protein
MDLKDKLILSLLGLVILLGLTGAVLVTWQKHVDDKQRVDLQNQLASKDKELQEAPGLYAKLALQEAKPILDQKDAQIQELQRQLKQTGDSLLDATQLKLTWQKAYEGLAKASQSQVSGQPSSHQTGSTTTQSRDRVDFSETFDNMEVTGYTMTNPPEAYLKLAQLRPLKLTVAVAQTKDGAWRTYVTSSEQNVRPDIQVTSVNPYLIETKWYEKLAVRADLGVGSTSAGAGVLLGVGATFEIGRFDVGPAVWLSVTDRADKFAGVMVGWHPFQR